MTRDEAIQELTEPFHFDQEIVDVVRRRLGYTEEDFERVMKEPTRSFRDFKTYKQRFERLRPLFAVLVKAQLVPKSFYLKYNEQGLSLEAQLLGGTGEAEGGALPC